MRVALSWSSGKDSAWALYRLGQQEGVEVVSLVTTLNESVQRIAMHAVRRELLERQAAAAELPLDLVPLPHPCPNDVYESAMRRWAEGALRRGIEGVAFGDLFLADVRRYRERLFADSRIEPLFPLWKTDTHALARSMVEAGLRARITCIDLGQMERRFAGREYNAELLRDLPDAVDPCGENGEFHTFVFAGPMLAESMAVEPGESVERDGFLYTDLGIRT